MILEKTGQFSRVLPNWKGNTVVLIAGGPSLKPVQVFMAKESGAKCIAVNDAYLIAPWADVNYFADAKWYEWHRDGIERPKLGFSAIEVKELFAEFAGEKCSIQNSGARIDDSKVHILKNAHEPLHGYGLSADPERIVTGRNSGFQALNIAVLAGAKKVLLLGYDGKPGKEASHWFGEHPSMPPMAVYDEYKRSFSAAEEPLKVAGVTVINCSDDSAIDSFPKMTLRHALAH